MVVSSAKKAGGKGDGYPRQSVVREVHGANGGRRFRGIQLRDDDRAENGMTRQAYMKVKVTIASASHELRCHL